MISNCRVRRRSGIVQANGTFNAVAAGSVAASTFLALGTIPDGLGLRPEGNIFPAVSMTAATTLQCQITAANGLIQVRAPSAVLAYTTAPNFSIAGASW